MHFIATVEAFIHHHHPQQQHVNKEKSTPLAIIIYAAILHHLECKNSVAMDALVFACYSFFWWVGWRYIPTNPHDKRMASSFLCPCCLVLSSQYVSRVCVLSRLVVISSPLLSTYSLFFCCTRGGGGDCRFSLDQPSFLSNVSGPLGN